MQARTRGRQERQVRPLVLAVVQGRTRLEERQRVRPAAHWGQLLGQLKINQIVDPTHVVSTVRQGNTLL